MTLVNLSDLDVKTSEGLLRLCELIVYCLGEVEYSTFLDIVNPILIHSDTFTGYRNILDFIISHSFLIKVDGYDVKILLHYQSGDCLFHHQASFNLPTEPFPNIPIGNYDFRTEIGLVRLCEVLINAGGYLKYSTFLSMTKPILAHKNAFRNFRCIIELVTKRSLLIRPCTTAGTLYLYHELRFKNRTDSPSPSGSETSSMSTDSERSLPSLYLESSEVD